MRQWLWISLVSSFLLGSCNHQGNTASGGAEQRQLVQRARGQGLVEVRQVARDVSIDLRYATRNNITGRALYPRHMPCLLRPTTAARLARAQQALRAQGYGLRIWDAWRPPEVQEQLHARGQRTGLYLDPRTGWSRHCGGVSVDATLIDLQGNEQRMPTAFDDSLAHAATDYRGADPVIRRNLHILHSAMKAAGLLPLPGEWWHFDDAEYLYTPAPVIRGSSLGLRFRFVD